MEERSDAPLVLVLLVALPLLYLGSYLALVCPEHSAYEREINLDTNRAYDYGYRNGGDWAWVVFWPLERIDRRLRPDAWPRREL